MFLFFLVRNVQSSQLHFLFGEAMYKVRGSTFYLGKPCTKFTAPLFVWVNKINTYMPSLFVIFLKKYFSLPTIVADWMQHLVKKIPLHRMIL